MIQTAAQNRSKLISHGRKINFLSFSIYSIYEIRKTPITSRPTPKWSWQRARCSENEIDDWDQRPISIPKYRRDKTAKSIYQHSLVGDAWIRRNKSDGLYAQCSNFYFAQIIPFFLTPPGEPATLKYHFPLLRGHSTDALSSNNRCTETVMYRMPSFLWWNA